ncbi:MAG: hypothetical protein IIX65_07270, partial [Lachnospiraceae bacterium]|nr:hypothetical protein [Lachnospiraceae bacterium]
DGTGRIPDEGDHIMRTMGEWLKTNGESIYGTRRTVDFPYQIRWGGITTKGNTLYFHILHTDEITHQVRICNMESKVKRVYLLETGEELTFFQTYELARDEHRFRIITEGKVKDPLDTVIVVELEDEPKAHSLYMDFERLLAKK